MKDIVLSWSSGKDAAYALYKLQQSKEYTIHSLFCTLEETSKRISMHGIPESLLDAQADSLGIPLQKLFLPKDLSMDEYGKIMKEELSIIKQRGVSSFAFGDILLEDLKLYREKQLASVNIEAIFPLWGKDTAKLAEEIIDSGIKAIVVAINCNVLDNRFIGREYDKGFLIDLPKDVDPCGENGEFHTFVYDAPNFQKPIKFKKGEVVKKEYSSDSENGTWDSSFLFQNLILQ